MKTTLDESQPIFQQIAQMIMDEIVEGQLKEGEQVPSENELSSFYNINRATVRRGLQELADKSIIYKQRGIGMFVENGAKLQLLKERQKQYREEYILPLLGEAKKIGLSVQDILQLIEEENK